jgi:hypothetical protein
MLNLSEHNCWTCCTIHDKNNNAFHNFLGSDKVPIWSRKHWSCIVSAARLRKPHLQFYTPIQHSSHLVTLAAPCAEMVITPLDILRELASVTYYYFNHKIENDMGISSSSSSSSFEFRFQVHTGNLGMQLCSLHSSLWTEKETKKKGPPIYDGVAFFNGMAWRNWVISIGSSPLRGLPPSRQTIVDSVESYTNFNLCFL